MGRSTENVEKPTEEAEVKTTEPVEGAETKTTIEAGDEDTSAKIIDKETGSLTEEALDADLDKETAFVGEGTDEEGKRDGEGDFEDIEEVKSDALDDDGNPIVARDPISEGDSLVHHPGGVFRNKEDGKVAYAPPGSYNAAMAGVQQDASGHFESAGHVRSIKSGTRV